MAKIVIIGEAWGQQEAEARTPFVGPSGRLLHAMLKAAGISKRDCYFTNVFNLQPRPTNDIKNLCGPKEEGVRGRPFLVPGKYVRLEFEPELARLETELRNEAPNLIIALGATANWFLTGKGKIKTARGYPVETPYGKALPTYHPAAILRQTNLRPVLYADLCKAKREAETPEVIRPQRELWIDPDLSDLEEFERRYMRGSSMVGCDIETIRKQISCIGFAPDPYHALVVPFIDERKPSGNYWPDISEESTAWKWVARVVNEYPLVFQNGLYDLNYLWAIHGIPVRGAAEDTMLLHHALQPEMEKGLGFLGSIYTTEPAWKQMRFKGTLKKED